MDHPTSAAGSIGAELPAAVELSGITVRFGENVANRGVSLSVAAGEVHAIVGENGAGKSTLMRALYGLAPLAAGEVHIRGEKIARPSAAESIRRGIGMVHQHFMLVDTLSVAENVLLGSEAVALGRLGAWSAKAAEAHVAALAERHGLAADPGRLVAELSVGEQQRVEILKALHRGARILIFDEPTAVLTPPEVADLFRVLRELRDAGGTVLLVTHKLDEVMSIADRVTVLRRGEVAARFERAEATPDAIARAMVGGEPPPRRVEPATITSDGESARTPRLSLRDVCVSGRASDGVAAMVGLAGVSLDLRSGEILGIAGVEGNGQAELIGAITGLRRVSRGSVLLDGSDVTFATTQRRRRLGVAYVPEDRHRLGLLMSLSIAENILLGREREYARRVLSGVGLGRGLRLGIDRVRLERDARALIERFDIRPADPAAPVAELSGGNQQKVILARELARLPRLLVAAQPTRGVDLFAVARIHRELDGARSAGAAVLLVSSDLDELFALSDRIAVLYRGRVVATLPRAEASAARLSTWMTGAAA